MSSPFSKILISVIFFNGSYKKWRIISSLVRWLPKLNTISSQLSRYFSMQSSSFVVSSVVQGLWVYFEASWEASLFIRSILTKSFSENVSGKFFSVKHLVHNIRSGEDSNLSSGIFYWYQTREHSEPQKSHTGLYK